MSASGTAIGRLVELVAANRAGRRAGLVSVCTAARPALDAAASLAAEHGGLLCVESTSSQVNQDGGYTGLRPPEFAALVAEVAAHAGLSLSQVVLGADHLGPYAWRDHAAATAMERAEELVRSCVLAGYAKIHLDCSMRCADDPGDDKTPPDEEVVTARAVRLCRAAEEAYGSLPPGAAAPVYVIGTEVPPPGGQTAGAAGPRITAPAQVRHTLALAEDAFLAADLDDAWGRVVALVVQPGVEFSDDAVHDYDPAAAAGLAASLDERQSIVFEAHSTDYQRPESLGRLVQDHFAILKVGPWLTHAQREALFALEAVERELLGPAAAGGSRLRETLDAAMLEDPRHWAPYVAGDEELRRVARLFGYSDRVRYYWSRPQVQQAVTRLVTNLSRRSIPLTLLSQHLPDEYDAVRAGLLQPEPGALVRHRIGRVLKAYAEACGLV